MPLVRSASKKARQENIRREIDAGKPIRQAVAIGYAEQRRARAKNRSGNMPENSEHGPGRIPTGESGGPTRQRHMMGEGERAMAGGDFGVHGYPGRRISHNQGDHVDGHDGHHLEDHERANRPPLEMGHGHMAATAHSHHGPHHHHPHHDGHAHHGHGHRHKR